MSKVQVYEQIIILPTYKAAAPEKSPLFIEKRAYRAARARCIPCR